MVSIFWGVHGLCKEVDEWKLGARVLCRCQHLTIEQMTYCSLQDRYIDVESHGIDLDPRSNNQKLDALGIFLQALETATDGMADNKLWQSPGDPVEWVDAKNDEERGKKFLNKCSKASAVKIKHVCTSVAGSTAHWCAEAARNHTTGAAAMIHGSVHITWSWGSLMGEKWRNMEGGLARVQLHLLMSQLDQLLSLQTPAWYEATNSTNQA